jgi:hypothetical protein
LIFEIFDFMFSDWVLFLTYPNLFGIKTLLLLSTETDMRGSNKKGFEGIKYI